MNLTDKVYAVLSTAPGLTNLVPVSRIKPPGVQQRLSPPYIVHFGMLDETTRTHGEGLMNLKKWLYQVSCFDASFSAAKNVSAQVVLALGNYRQGGINSIFMRERPMPYEEDVRIQQIVLEFEIWETL